jgi:release factor glutamine methyltransferase
MSPTLGEALRETARRLASAPSPSPERDAEELLSRLLGVARSRLHVEAASPFDPVLASGLEAWVRRRIAGEPVQYITGRAAFRHLDLAVTRAVLIPRPETEGLVGIVLAELRAVASRRPAPRVLDLGTGSGAVALAIAHEDPAAAVTAADRSEAALEVARANARALGLEARVTFARGDWFGAVGADDRFDVVVSNPPYIATEEWDDLPDDVRRFEPAEALFSGPHGLDAVREIVDDAPLHLVAGGLLAVELAEARAREVAAWLEGASDWASVELADDLAGRPRYLIARRQGGPAIAPAQWSESR